VDLTPMNLIEIERMRIKFDRKNLKRM